MINLVRGYKIIEGSDIAVTKNRGKNFMNIWTDTDGNDWNTFTDGTNSKE